MRLLIIIIAIVCASTAADSVRAEQRQNAKPTEKQLLLQRIYQMRIRFEQERARAENEARANVRLVNQGGLRAGVDSPTVTGLRQQTNQQLSRFESQFQCLDVEVEANSGNTVVICGDNTGDINGTNVSAQRDIVTVNGGQN
jgi:hypothetical protein